MGVIKRFKADKRKKLAGNMLAIQDFIAAFAEAGVMASVSIRSLPLAKKGIVLNQAFVKKFATDVMEGMKEDDKVKEVLSEICFSNGYDEGVGFDIKAIEKFSRAMLESITEEALEEAYKAYTEQRQSNLEEILRQTREKLEMETGEEVVHIKA